MLKIKDKILNNKKLYIEIALTTFAAIVLLIIHIVYQIFVIDKQKDFEAIGNESGIENAGFGNKTFWLFGFVNAYYTMFTITSILFLIVGIIYLFYISKLKGHYYQYAWSVLFILSFFVFITPILIFLLNIWIIFRE